MATVEVVSAPAPLEVRGVPPWLDVALGGEHRHFVKGFVEKADISGIDDGAFQHGGIYQHHVSLNDIGPFETGKDFVFNERDALLAHAFSEAAKRRGIHKSSEALIRDMAKVLNVAVFLDIVDHFASAELAQSSQDGDGD